MQSMSERILEGNKNMIQKKSAYDEQRNVEDQHTRENNLFESHKKDAREY